MFARISVVSIALLTAFTGVVHAAPMDVYAPPLLTPAKGAEWIIGTEELVTWDTSHPPKQITSRNATIYLSRNGYLDYKNPLATGFDIMDGQRRVIVPNVPEDINYQLVLFGDSGNSGPIFSIHQPY